MDKKREIFNIIYNMSSDEEAAAVVVHLFKKTKKKVNAVLITWNHI